MTRRSTPRRSRHAPPDRAALYELCVQSPAATAAWLDAAHGGTPRVLREDFSGGAAICRAWVHDRPARRAVAVDRDPQPLSRLAGVPGVRAVCADVMTVRAKADVIAALNFPLGYFFDRGDLIAYLRASRARLHDRGIFMSDTYGGRNAFSPGVFQAAFRTPAGETVAYEWEHREADPVTGRVVNAIHFRVGSGKSAIVLREAFVYEWRLWSIPELRDAYREAGFRKVEVYDHSAGAYDHLGRLHMAPATDLDDDWVVYVVGRT